MSVIKKKRGALSAEQEQQKKFEPANRNFPLSRNWKNSSCDPTITDKSYSEFKKLQQQWNEVKLIPQAKVNELWKVYQLSVEKFYEIGWSS